MGLKSFIQNSMHEKQVKKYELEVERQSDAYQAFIDVQEKEGLKKCISLRDADATFGAVRVADYSEFTGDFQVLEGSCSYILFLNGEGTVPEKLGRLIQNTFEDDPELNVIYFDEDIIDKESGKRSNPWFKPEFALDSLLNSFYFGNIVAVRKAAIDKELLETIEGSDNGLVNVYNVVLDMCIKKEARHVDSVCFHRFAENDCQSDMNNDSYYLGAGSEFDSLKIRAYEKMGHNAKFSQDEYGVSHGRIAIANKKVLIVIPSKDHPDVLERCVKSIKNAREKAESKISSRIVVVDNGSNDENKAKYEELSQIYGYKYIYESMDFNFSVMCNKGAESEESDYILFLNDDTEVITPEWLDIMAGQASLSHVGAVGAKLLYPDGNTIQHVGVTNMTEGPAHKLLGYDDGICEYHGANRVNQNVLAVTAACLMVSREKYIQAEKMPEQLKVAYNDVFFCFSLYMKGYFNVIRNDVKLLHYESLSRGDDHADIEKLNRLKSERNELYKYFTGLYGYDPFYSKWLTGASEKYECVLPFENRNIRPVSVIDEISFPKEPVNETLIINIDRAELEPLYNSVPCVLLDLHSHVRGLDNADYSFRLILKTGDRAFEVPVIRRFRPDVIKVLYNEIHVELSGFVARIPFDVIMPGEYEIWMEAKSQISRQVLLNKAEGKLIFGGEQAE